MSGRQCQHLKKGSWQKEYHPEFYLLGIVEQFLLALQTKPYREYQ
ncbi:hypothetical protein D046_7170A, partial [Vibrio parahaemolyticus V-223/04]